MDSFQQPQSHECTTEAAGNDFLIALPRGSVSEAHYALCMHLRRTTLLLPLLTPAPASTTTNPSDLDSRCARVIAPCSFNPKSLLLDSEVLHWMKSLHAKGRHFHWGRCRDNNSGLQIWREYNLWCRQKVGWPTAAVLYPALVHLEDCMTSRKLWWWPWETFRF